MDSDDYADAPEVQPGHAFEQDAAPRHKSLRSVARGIGDPPRHKLQRLRDQARKKVKRLLNADGAAADAETSDHDSDLDDMLHNPAFDPATANVRAPDDRRTAPPATAPSALRTAAAAIANPKSTIKRHVRAKAAAEISKSQQLPTSKREDLEYLAAHDRLRLAGTGQSSAPSDREAEADLIESRESLRTLGARRLALQAAWSTHRIWRARVVQKHQVSFPRAGGPAEAQAASSDRARWGIWLGHVLLWYTQGFAARYVDDFEEPPFDIDVLRSHVERLVMASASWQTWLLSVRSVFRWEHPRRTAAWLALYIFLWQTEHIFGFVWAYVVSIVLMNRFSASSVERTRASAERAVHGAHHAAQISELMEKHGDEWLDAILDVLGPYVQLQVSDMADMLEVLQNFYRWRSPTGTWGALLCFVVCLLLSLLTDLSFCFRIVGFLSGGAFFLCWPIASLYPRYRLLVSPFKWMLWDIPTNAEWSFQYLQHRAQLYREKTNSKSIEKSAHAETELPPDPQRGDHMHSDYPRTITSHDDDSASISSSASSSTSMTSFTTASSMSTPPSGQSLFSFRATYSILIGRLVIHASGISFVRSFRHKTMWYLDWAQLMELRKLGKSSKGKRSVNSRVGMNQLEILSTSGETFLVDKIRGRDEAFNAMIGWSGMEWQSLQIGDPDRTGMKSGG